MNPAVSWLLVLTACTFGVWALVALLAFADRAVDRSIQRDVARALDEQRAPAADGWRWM